MLKIVSKKEYEKLLEWKERYEEKEQELLMVKKGFEIYKEDVEKKKKLETRQQDATRKTKKWLNAYPDEKYKEG